MSEILEYYESIYSEVPQWVQNFYRIDEKSLENYTTLRNNILKSKSLKKYEMDMIIVAVNAYRGYEDSMFMHSLSALNSGGSIEEIQAMINSVTSLKQEEAENLLTSWSHVLKRLHLDEHNTNTHHELSRETQLIVICCVYMANLQSSLAVNYLREYIINRYDMNKLEEGILACLLTAGVPVIFEITKALEEAKQS